jgi:hypothetical protein
MSDVTDTLRGAVGTDLDRVGQTVASTKERPLALRGQADVRA